MVDLLAKGGITLNPANVELGLALAEKAALGATDPAQAGAGPVAGEPAADTAHGGPVDQVPPLSKRSGDQTGKMDGMGMAGAVN